MYNMIKSRLNLLLTFARISTVKKCIFYLVEGVSKKIDPLK